MFPLAKMGVLHKNGTKIFTAKRKGNLYRINLSELSNQNLTCLVSINGNHWVWHEKHGHVSLRLIPKLQRHDLVRGLPRMSYKDDLLCEACQKGKQIKTSFLSKNFVSTSRTLELLHVDLFGPTGTTSVSGKRYGLVVVDDYSRWTWVMFLTHKNESFEVFFKFCKRVQNEKEVCITLILLFMKQNLYKTHFKNDPL